jgi:transposase-like protein
MVDDARKEEQLYRCDECGFHYRDKATAERCRAWCREHKSCNLDITKDAVENERST